MADVGFEPTLPKCLVPKTKALDHSATDACKIPKYLSFVTTVYVFKWIFFGLNFWFR